MKPLIYTGQSACVSYDWSAVAKAGYRLWLAQYANDNETDYNTSPWQKGSVGAFSRHVMHQYTGNGRITGYGRRLDLDLFYGGSDDWKVLARAGN